MTDIDREQKERHGLRLVFMVLFWLVLRLSYFITGLIALIQWIWLWFEDTPSSRIRRFSRNLVEYQRRILDYLLFNSSVKPFPFDDWPEIESDDHDPEPDNRDARQDEASGSKA